MLAARAAMRATYCFRQPVLASASAEGARSSSSSGSGSSGPKDRRIARGSQRGQDRQLTSTAAATAAGPAGAAAPCNAEPHPTPFHRSISMLNRHRALLLDSTYRPVGVANWQRAICLDLLDKADVLEYYESSVRSVQAEFFLPAVLRVRRHRSSPIKQARVSLSRANILLRDGHSCQYCGSSRELTLDHIVPQSKGGGNTWQNLVACCTVCNSKKGDKSLEQLRWKLRQAPKEPSTHEMEFLLSSLVGTASQDALPLEWQAYILPFNRKKKQQQQQALQQAHQKHQ